jgi:GNAT superfamily N-acetyltransferase
MLIRQATIADIPAIQLVRNAVRENRLSNPSLVTNEDCETFLTQRGKGWVNVVDDTVVGFAIADLQGNNIWALFLLPQYERQGIGKKLHQTMLHWYFANTHTTLWLSTAPGTRAENFYHKAGWTVVGTYGKGEVKFEMRFEDWQTLQKNQ